MFITIALIPIFRAIAVKKNILDVPNCRKVHRCPMPKVGGMAIAVGALVPVLFFLVNQTDAFMRSVLMGAWIVVCFGFLDDLRAAPEGRSILLVEPGFIRTSRERFAGPFHRFIAPSHAFVVRGGGFGKEIAPCRDSHSPNRVVREDGIGILQAGKGFGDAG